MATLTIQQLRHICPAVKNPEQFIPALNAAFGAYAELATPQAQAMFLAQCLHESGGFKFLKEIWGPTAWQKKYEGHAGLGNTRPGDGKKFMGRGLIQITGRDNYTKFDTWICNRRADAAGIVDHPERLEDPDMAVLSAVWFWVSNKLDRYAGNIEGCTRRVNGPKMLGLEERKAYYRRGLEVLA